MNIFGLVYITLGLLYLLGCCLEDREARRNIKAFSYKIRKKLCYKLYKNSIYPIAIKPCYIYISPEDMLTISSKVKVDPHALFSACPKDKVALDTVYHAVNTVLEEVKNNLLIIESMDLRDEIPVYQVSVKIPKVEIYRHTNDKRVYRGLREFERSLKRDIDYTYPINIWSDFY